jgi:hypothetical protein
MRCTREGNLEHERFRVGVSSASRHIDGDRHRQPDCRGSQLLGGRRSDVAGPRNHRRPRDRCASRGFLFFCETLLIVWGARWCPVATPTPPAPGVSLVSDLGHACLASLLTGYCTSRSGRSYEFVKKSPRQRNAPTLKEQAMVGQASVPASSRRQGRRRHQTSNFFTSSTRFRKHLCVTQDTLPLRVPIWYKAGGGWSGGGGDGTSRVVCG